MFWILGAGECRAVGTSCCLPIGWH